MKVHIQFLKPKSELVTGKIPDLWLNSYGITHWNVLLDDAKSKTTGKQP